MKENKKRWFKVQVGYNSNEFVSIDETELELALYIFLTDSKAIFKNGVCRGKDIIGIKEDWHKAMGINPEWKLNTNDYNEIEKQGIKKLYHGVIENSKNRVQYLIKENKEHLIGKNVEIPSLENKGIKVLSEGSKKLVDKFNMNKD